MNLKIQMHWMINQKIWVEMQINQMINQKIYMEM